MNRLNAFLAAKELMLAAVPHSDDPLSAVLTAHDALLFIARELGLHEQANAAQAAAEAIRHADAMQLRFRDLDGKDGAK